MSFLFPSARSKFFVRPSRADPNFSLRGKARILRLFSTVARLSLSVLLSEPIRTSVRHLCSARNRQHRSCQGAQYNKKLWMT
jgi:hypothetical protein